MTENGETPGGETPDVDPQGNGEAETSGYLSTSDFDSFKKNVNHELAGRRKRLDSIDAALKKLTDSLGNKASTETTEATPPPENGNSQGNTRTFVRIEAALAAFEGEALDEIEDLIDGLPPEKQLAIVRREARKAKAVETTTPTPAGEPRAPNAKRAAPSAGAPGELSQPTTREEWKALDIAKKRAVQKAFPEFDSAMLPRRRSTEPSWDL